MGRTIIPKVIENTLYLPRYFVSLQLVYEYDNSFDEAEYRVQRVGSKL